MLDRDDERKKLARIIRGRSAAILDQEEDQARRDDAEFLNVLARLLEGKTLYQAFGSPGSWGYGTPIGDALAAAYRPAREAIVRHERPVIVCLCGSTRFTRAWQEANLAETLAGRIVLSVGCVTSSDAELLRQGKLTSEQKAMLDELHKRKIDLADEVLVLNVGGYVGDSTRSEVLYARQHLKPVRWLEPDAVPADLDAQSKGGA